MRQAVDAVMEEAKSADAINADIIENDVGEWISLKAFLKLKRYDDKEKKKIKNRFKALGESDGRLKNSEGKMYLNPSQYDYSDLLR